MGLCNLKYVPEIIRKRKEAVAAYDRLLDGVIQRPNPPAHLEYNYAYYPIFLDNEKALISVKEALEKERIRPRRYFYPSLNLLPYLHIRQTCPISENTASRVLSLPLYDDLPMEDVERISSLVKKAVG